MSFQITKASGEKEPFNIAKFKRSLKKCSAPTKLIIKIAQKIEKMPRLRTTKQIYAFALKELERANPALAARYNLKQALIYLGPTGYPFELFIAQIFKAQGYAVKLNEIAYGYCIEHELDLVATKKKKMHIMVECKFHNRQKFKSDVKIPLYVKARFDDLERAWRQNPDHGHEFHQAWVATNTKFTSQAVDYSACVGLKLLDWSHPKGSNLPLLIQKYSLYPITTLTSLSMSEKKEIIRSGIILCSAIAKNEWVLKKIGLHARDRRKIIKEATDLCRFNDILNHKKIHSR